MSVFFALFLFCLSGSALAQISLKGSCPKIEAMKDFDISKFLGIWNEMERYYTPTINNTVKCVTYEWKKDAKDTIVQIATVMTARDGIKILKPAVIKTPEATKPGMLKQKYTWLKRERDISILATDYTSYALVYNCIDNNKRRRYHQYAWILTRDLKPEENVMPLVDEAIKMHKLNRTAFTAIKHDDCEVKP